MQELTPQEAYYLTSLVSLDINKAVGEGKPLEEIHEKQHTLAKLRRLAGEEEKRVAEDTARAFQEFRRQARMDAYYAGELE